MGLFGGKKTYVTSVVYNLAGDIEDRPDYLKSLVIRNNIYGTNDMTQTLYDGYIYGPGLKLRSFGRWSQGDYADVMGTSWGSLPGADSLDVEVLREQISLSLGGVDITIQAAQLGFPEVDWWADQWMLANHPDLMETAWESDYDEQTGEILIRLEDGTMYAFEPEDYDTNSKYIYAVYNTVTVIHHPADPGDPEADPPIPPTDAYDEWVYGNMVIYLYKIGSGNAVLDAMVLPDNQGGFFFPIIPIRVDNKFIGPDKDQWGVTDLDEDATEEEIEDAFEANKEATPEADLPINFPDLYPMAKRAVKKSIGGKFGDITDNLTKNVSLDDIDYAYAVFGVCINTKEAASRLYLWRFFERLLATQGDYDPDLWQLQMEQYQAQMAIWKAWFDGDQSGPEPERPTVPALLTQYVRVYATGGENAINYDMIINWNGMAHSEGSGLGKPEAKKGDVWWVVDADIEFTEILYYGSSSTEVPRNREQVTLYYQKEDDAWEAITIWDLLHRNFVYEGKAVEIGAKQALLSLDDDGNAIPYEESGFIIPLHYGTFKDMPLVKSTQMSTACCYLVINCYKVVKKKWYQTGIFQIFLIVVIIAVTVATGGLGGVGILGSNLAVGSALGFTGTAAALVGGIANAIAAMLILKAVGMVSTAVFGEKFGAIIGAIAGVVAITIGVGLANGGYLSAAIGQLGRPENLYKLTQAAGTGYSAYVKASIKQMQAELVELQNSNAEQMDEIQDLYEKNIGYGRASLDPALFGQVDTYVPEASGVFLSRTLMTASDMIEFSLSLIHDFSALTLSTDLPR